MLFILTYFRQKLQAYVHILGKKLTTYQKIELNEHQQRLKSRVEKFQLHGRSLMSIDPEDKIRLFPQLEVIDDDASDDDDSSSEDQNYLWNKFQEETVEKPAEQISIIMPSALTFAERKRLNIDHLVLQETQLREGQANDVLEALRNTLGQKSFIFRSQVRNARS